MLRVTGRLLNAKTNFSCFCTRHLCSLNILSIDFMIRYLWCLSFGTGKRVLHYSLEQLLRVVSALGEFLDGIELRPGWLAWSIPMATYCVHLRQDDKMSLGDRWSRTSKKWEWTHLQVYELCCRHLKGVRITPTYMSSLVGFWRGQDGSMSSIAGWKLRVNPSFMSFILGSWRGWEWILATGSTLSPVFLP